MPELPPDLVDPNQFGEMTADDNLKPVAGRKWGPWRLYELLRAGAGSLASTPAMTFAHASGDQRTWSRGELFETAEMLAARLPVALGPGPIGILLEEQEDQVLHYLAVLASGRIPAILTNPNRKLNAAYYLETIASLLRKIPFDAVITDLPGLVDSELTVLAPHTLTGKAHRVTTTGTRPSPDTAFIQFSSGTTGIKKGVTVSAEAVASQVSIYGQAIDICADDVVVSWLPLYHDMGFMTALNLPLATGAHAVMVHPIQWVTKPRNWLDLVMRYHGTLAWHPNFAYQFMAERVRTAEAFDLSSIRMLANCSEPTTAKAQTVFASAFAAAGLRHRVFAGCYAMAETTFAVTHQLATDFDGLDDVGPSEAPSIPRPIPTVGKALPAVEVALEHLHGRPAGDRELSELMIRAPFLASGYFANERATTEAFPNGWYHTGDLGYRIGDMLYVTGRKKDLIIIAGVNVHPGDVEELVSTERGVQPGRVAAFSTFDDRNQTERMTVLVEPAGDAVEIHLPSVRSRLIAVLGAANFEVHVVEPGWLVKSTSGKMARLLCRDKWLSTHGKTYE